VNGYVPLHPPAYNSDNLLTCRPPPLARSAPS
jgi:hypothetical protein